MEYLVRPAGDRKVTKDLLLRFIRTSHALSVEIQFIGIHANGTGLTSATVEIPEVYTGNLEQIQNLATVDGFRMEPVQNGGITRINKETA